MDRRTLDAMSDFTLHPQLAADTSLVASLPLCECLLMNDSRYCWLILVPRLPGLRDLHEIPPAHRGQVFAEIDAASRALASASAPYKINVAALGNQVEQLHIHVIARHRDDPAWPNPVWGSGTAAPYSARDRQALSDALRAELAPG